MYPLILKGHERPVTCVKFNYDGDLFYSASAENKINLWRAFTGERLGSFASKGSVKALDVDINCEHLITCSFDGTIQVFEALTGILKMAATITYKLKHIEFDYGAKRFVLIADSFSSGDPSRIFIVNFADFLRVPNQGKQVDAFESNKFFSSQKSIETRLSEVASPAKKVSHCAWYVDGSSIFFCTEDGYIAQFGLDGQEVKKAHIHPEQKIHQIAFSKDFSILATAAVNGCKILDPETLDVLRVFKQELPMNAVAISPLFCSPTAPKFHMIMGGGVPAMMAAMTSGNAGFEAHVCNVMHGSEIGRIPGHFGPINSIEFFKDGRGFVSGGEQGIIRVVRFPDVYFEEGNEQFE